MLSVHVVRAWAVRVQAPDAHGVLGGQAVLVVVRHAVGQLPQPARAQQLPSSKTHHTPIRVFFRCSRAHATLPDHT